MTICCMSAFSVAFGGKADIAGVFQRPCLSRYDACPEPGVLDAAARVFQRNWGCGGLAARC